MRQSFIETLTRLAAHDSRIVFITGDLGYSVVEPFAEAFPDRFFNVGVAEQNMVGMATGLAEAGFLPFIYSITSFATLRPYEFIRNGPIAHAQQVRIVAVGGGVEYGHAGITHFGLEDLGVMRIQPGITVVAPADFQQARTALENTWDLPGPVYYAIGKDATHALAGLNGRFELGRVQFIEEGSDLLIVTIGTIAHEARKAATLLNQQGISCGTALVSTLRPPPVTDLSLALSKVPLAVTVEAHYTVGGLGSLVSEIVAEHGLNCRVLRCGFDSMPHGASGGPQYWYQEYGLTANQVADSARAAFESLSA